ncbi:MAG: pilus (MSHA type) biogenesis protein MshL [Wenzhouxiangellaceae bacterium]
MKIDTIRLTTAIALLLLAGACGTVREQGERTDREIDRAMEQAMSAPEPTPEQTRALLMPEPEPLAEAPPEERFDVFVDDAPARAFLMSLVTDSDWNMVVHPQLTGRVSLELKNVTVPEVLEVMRQVYGYEYSETSAGFIVEPARMHTRVYEIDYLSLNRIGVSRTRVSSGQSTNLPPSLLDSSGSRSFGRSSTGDQDEDDSSSTRIQTDNETRFWEELATAVQSLVGGENGARVITNAQAGVLSVHAMPDGHRAVSEFLTAVEGSVQRQVILEARIIEVELRDEFRSGINWEAMFSIGGTDFNIGQVAGQGLFEEGTSAIRGVGRDIAAGTLPSGFSTTAFGGPFTLAAGSSDFSSFIELLETQGNTRVLSSPRIATVNNQKAVIKVGNDEFFVTGIESQTAAGTATSTTASTVQLTPFFSGVALDVTPQISADGNVILHVHPSISEVREQVKQFTTSGQEETLPLAFSTVRESDSIIRARSGEVVVIGGLMRDMVSEERIGTPGISRVPLIGHLFGSRQNRSIKTELVILIRPVVVDSSSVWADQARERLDRIRQLGGREAVGGGSR